MWETEADLLANETSDSYRNQVAKISLCLADQPLREAYVTGIAESANTGFKHNPPRPDPDRLRIASHGTRMKRLWIACVTLVLLC